MKSFITITLFLILGVTFDFHLCAQKTIVHNAQQNFSNISDNVEDYDLTDCLQAALNYSQSLQNRYRVQLESYHCDRTTRADDLAYYKREREAIIDVKQKNKAFLLSMVEVLQKRNKDSENGLNPASEYWTGQEYYNSNTETSDWDILEK